MIVWSYCHHCEKMRRFRIICWSANTERLGPALVPIVPFSKTMIYTPETAEGWVVDARCLLDTDALRKPEHAKRMVVPRAWAEARAKTETL